MKFQTGIEPHAYPDSPATMYATQGFNSLSAETASLVPISSILIRQTADVRHVPPDMCKTPPTSPIRTAWPVRTVKDEQAHKLHARIAPTDNLAAETVFADDAPETKYQTAEKPIVRPATAAERQATTAFSVSAPADKWVR